MTGHSITGPIAPYNNVPIHIEYFKPRQFFIENITLGKTTIITTTTDHDYIIGQLVRLIIPFFSGCRQLNEVEGYVISIPADDQIEADIDSSRNVDLFVTTSNAQQPQILAIGDVNNGIIVSTGQSLPINVIPGIPGAFKNISPFDPDP